MWFLWHCIVHGRLMNYYANCSQKHFKSASHSSSIALGSYETDCSAVDWVRTLTRGGMYWKIHPPRPKRFPEGGDFAPRGPRDCPRAKPEGNLEGRGVQNPRLREISRAEGGVFSNASLLSSVYGHSFIIIREVLIFWYDNRWRCYLSTFV